MHVYPKLTKYNNNYSINGSKLKAGETVIDLDFLPEYVKATELNPNPTNPDWYKIGTKKHGALNVDASQQFLFVNGNLMRFYGIDLDGDVSLDELQQIIDLLKKPVNQAIEDRRKIKENFLKTGSLKQWEDKGKPNKIPKEAPVKPKEGAK